MEARLAAVKPQQEETERPVSLMATLEEFCQNIRAALATPSFATKQRLLRLVVEQIVVTDEQITIKHVIPLSDVRLQRQHSGPGRPIWTAVNGANSSVSQTVLPVWSCANAR
jgi:hypothetical protein